MSYGFTNDRSVFDAVCAYRDAAVADGWVIKPTYGDHESVDRAASLTRDGFSMMILTRSRQKPTEKWAYEAQMNIWGPDGLTIKPPPEYSWDKIVAGLKTCNECGAICVSTKRFGFAGRACEKCLPAMKKRHEYPGWCD